MRNLFSVLLSLFVLFASPNSFASFNTDTNDSVVFEEQIFSNIDNSNSQYIELTQKEMKETEGAAAQVIYGLVRGSRVVYVGITNNLARRTAAHKATKQFDTVRVLGTHETRQGGRIIEQNFINKYNTINNGYNKINSISPRNPLASRVTVPYRR